MGDMEPKSRPRLGLDEVQRAAERVATHLHKTPVLTSTYLNALAGKQLFFKAEHLQKTGSFKARGACNAVGGHILFLVMEGRVNAMCYEVRVCLAYLFPSEATPPVCLMLKIIFLVNVGSGWEPLCVCVCVWR